MAELKTKPNDASVESFLHAVEDQRKRDDSFEILKMMEDITGAKAKMWGGSIIGFGDYHYKYASGREGDWFLTGFSPRKQSMTIYMMSGIKEDELFNDLGKYKTGKGCLYFKTLDDIDRNVLKKMIKKSVTYLKKK